MLVRLNVVVPDSWSRVQFIVLGSFALGEFSTFPVVFDIVDEVVRGGLVVDILVVPSLEFRERDTFGTLQLSELRLAPGESNAIFCLLGPFMVGGFSREVDHAGVSRPARCLQVEG